MFLEIRSNFRNFYLLSIDLFIYPRSTFFGFFILLRFHVLVRFSEKINLPPVNMEFEEINKIIILTLVKMIHSPLN